MIARTVDNLWGWQSVTPENIDAAQWNELYEVYQKDRYRLGLRRFFQQENAWAEQSVSARMLEAVRKEFWNAPRQIRTELARNYAQSVIDNGVACCDHTCNNPLLHQMVVNLISVPGVMTPESVAKFQIAVERAAAAGAFGADTGTPQPAGWFETVTAAAGECAPPEPGTASGQRV